MKKRAVRLNGALAETGTRIGRATRRSGMLQLLPSEFTIDGRVFKPKTAQTTARLALWQMAEAGDADALIQLGKECLGQRDYPLPDGMSEAEFLEFTVSELRKRGVRIAEGPEMREWVN